MILQKMTDHELARLTALTGWQIPLVAEQTGLPQPMVADVLLVSTYLLVREQGTTVTRLMGQTILNRIGGFEPNLHQSDEQAENEAPPGGDEDGEAPPGEDQPEGGAAPVAEDSAAQEEPVEATPIDATAIADPSETVPAEEVCAVEMDACPVETEACPSEVEDAIVSEAQPLRVLPDGFIAIAMNGRTPDGSVPYFILKNQLDRMR